MNLTTMRNLPVADDVRQGCKPIQNAISDFWMPSKTPPRFHEPSLALARTTLVCSRISNMLSFKPILNDARTYNVVLMGRTFYVHSAEKIA